MSFNGRKICIGSALVRHNLHAINSILQIILVIILVDFANNILRLKTYVICDVNNKLKSSLFDNSMNNFLHVMQK